MYRLVAIFCALATTFPAYGNGFFVGLGASLNNTNDLDHENDGIRLDWGTKVHPNLDLEWSIVDFGESSYNDPTFVAGNTSNEDEDDDLPNFTDLGFGDVSRSESNPSYKGISRLHVRGLSAGLKLHGSVSKWVSLFARGSMMAWEAETDEIEIYGPREALDINGDPVPDGSETTINNLTPCGGVEYCRIEKKGKMYWAVNYWLGAGLIFMPLDWLRIRTEASSIILKAEGFPQAQYESIGATVEMHF